MPNPCRHRTLTAVIPNQDPPTFSVPTEPGPIDELLVYLCSKDLEVDEVVVNAMELLFKSQRAKDLITGTGENLAVIGPGGGAQVGTPTERTIYALELLMAMGFLTGTAIGFAAGLEFESGDGDEFDDEVD